MKYFTSELLVCLNLFAALEVGAEPKVEAVKVPLTKLGEGPHWNAEKQELYYTDLLGQSVHRYVPSTGEHALVNVRINEDRVTLVIPVEGQPNKYIVAVGRTLQILEWDGSTPEPTSLTELFAVEADQPTHRFNDGKADVNGRLWAGTMDDANHKIFVSHLYRVTPVDIQSVQDKIGISNGIAWSRCSTKMYYVDTAKATVDVMDFDIEKGTISNRKVLYDFKKQGDICEPDGMEIDTDENLWVACWAGYQIIQINSTSGEKLSSIAMPTKQITSIAFGGPELDVMYVTSAQDRLTDEEKCKQPSAGALFKISDVGVKGLRAGVNFGPMYAIKVPVS